MLRGMVQRSAYADGEPCWADVLAPDVDAARRFYAGVFGWTFRPEYGDYVMCSVEGSVVAGISPLPPADSGVPAPAAWSIYLSNGDVNAAAATVERLGGKITMGPVDVPDNGRMLFALDPTGAAFGAWQPGRHTGAQLFGEPGALCWAELNTTAPSVADAFYAGLFGYRQEQIGDGSTFDYSAWTVPGGETVCGRLAMTAEWHGIPPHWMVYFTVADTDAAADRVVDCGGSVRQGPFDSPHGRIAVIADPGGAVLSIIDPTVQG
jgi:predicted enzyme related to lactoylglutathione lyase